MMRFAADENFILRGLKRQLPELDVVWIQDTEIYQADDSDVLEWTAQQGCILLSHDVQTMPGHAYERVREGKPIPVVFIVIEGTSLGLIIEELLTTIEASDPDEWANLVTFLPI